MPKVKSAKKCELPAWANEPLKFLIPPDEALRRGAFAKPKKAWNKVITTGRKTR